MEIWNQYPVSQNDLKYLAKTRQKWEIIYLYKYAIFLQLPTSDGAHAFGLVIFFYSVSNFLSYLCAPTPLRHAQINDLFWS